jgi:hypothetical protein
MVEYQIRGSHSLYVLGESLAANHRYNALMAANIIYTVNECLTFLKRRARNFMLQRTKWDLNNYRLPPVGSCL